MNIGDRVRVIAIPADVTNIGEIAIRELFEKCIGRSFIVARNRTSRGSVGTIVAVGCETSDRQRTLFPTDLVRRAVCRAIQWGGIAVGKSPYHK